MSDALKCLSIGVAKMHGIEDLDGGYEPFDCPTLVLTGTVEALRNSWHGGDVRLIPAEQVKHAAEAIDALASACAAALRWVDDPKDPLCPTELVAQLHGALSLLRGTPAALASATPTPPREGTP